MTRGITPFPHTRHKQTLVSSAEENIHNSSSSSSGDDCESDIDSPTKRYKGMVTSAINMTPLRRSFGEELEQNSNNNNNNTNHVIIANTSLLRSWTTESSSKEDSAVSSLSAGIADDISLSDDVSHVTEGSNSVAHLRGWLNDFGKQQKKHYDKNRAVGQTPQDAQRPTRPKVSNNNTNNKSDHDPTPLPPPAASALARRLVEPGRPRPRATPVRMIHTRDASADVRATNEGYKSVKQLSAWLADDPTKNKTRVKCLRRGANVIAKSRAFDKGLKDVIIEQDLGRSSVRGLVATKKQLLAPTTSSVDTSINSRAAEETENVQDWPDSMETASAISVSDKKQWLNNAFKKSGIERPKAHTEVITAKDERDAVSNRAKHLWRQRATKAKSAASPTTTTTMTFTQKSIAACKSSSTTQTKNIKPVIVKTSSQTASTADTKKHVSMQPPVQRKNNPPPAVPEVKTEQMPHDDTESPTKYGFSAAREFLLQKSRQNGNPVDIGKVKNRTANLERLETRRKSSQALTKTSWVSSGGDDVNDNSTYVREEVPKTKAAKKSIEELP